MRKKSTSEAPEGTLLTDTSGPVAPAEIQEALTGEVSEPQKKRRGRKPKSELLPPPEPMPLFTEADFVLLWGAVFAVMAKRWHPVWELTPDEMNRLCAATVPLANKYGPYLAQWWPEVSFAFVFGSLVYAKAMAEASARKTEKAVEKIEEKIGGTE